MDEKNNSPKLIDFGFSTCIPNEVKTIYFLFNINNNINIINIYSKNIKCFVELLLI